MALGSPGNSAPGRRVMGYFVLHPRERMQQGLSVADSTRNGGRGVKTKARIRSSSISRNLTRSCASSWSDAEVLTGMLNPVCSIVGAGLRRIAWSGQPSKLALRNEGRTHWGRKLFQVFCTVRRRNWHTPAPVNAVSAQLPREEP